MTATLPKAQGPWTLFEAAHLLNRAGFGGSPTAIKSMHSLGREKAVESLLAPTEALDAFPPPAWSDEKVALADFKNRLEIRKDARNLPPGITPEEAERKRREANQQIGKIDRQQILEAQAWWFDRMLKSEAPLREKMTLFWHDHFATSVQKVNQPVLVFRQNELFRVSALGSFKDLTQKILLDPAMMLYLDTQSSKKGMPNENFAREVMELFTLGEGNYTEQDIQEAARAFTGYQINRLTGTVRHNTRQWDDGEKTIFGTTGKFNGSDVVNLIFEKKDPARFMAKKLWQFFVYEEPSPAAITALAQIYQQENFQTAALLREIFLSKEFYSEAAIRTQIKCPLQYLVSLIKQLEITEPPAGFPIVAQQQLGQTLFLPPNVAGWDWGQAWINTNTLLTRYNLAGFLTKGSSNKRMKVPSMDRGWKGPDYETIAPRELRTRPEDLVDSLIYRFFQAPLPQKVRLSFIAYANAKSGVIFTNQEVGELCHLMLSTPYYQLC